MVSSGFGTEHIEEEVQKLFPDYVINRLDSDTITKKKVLKDTLSKFKKGK